MSVKFVTKLPSAFLKILIYTLLANDFQAALGYGIWSIVSLRHASKLGKNSIKNVFVTCFASAR